MLILLVSTIAATPTNSCGHGIVNVVQTRTSVQITKKDEYIGKDVYLSFECTENNQRTGKIMPAGTKTIEVDEKDVSSCFEIRAWVSLSETDIHRLD